MTPPVTCIIPCRNGAATLERAIESALDAGCNQVVAVIDSSTDKSYEVFISLREKYSRLTGFGFGADEFIYGVNFIRNSAIHSAPWGLIIPLDADDTLCDIRPLVEAWQPGTWVYGDYYQQEGHHISRIPGAPAGALARKEITGITFLFHKDDWLKVGGYDPDFAYCEDYAFQCALTHASVKPVYVEAVLYERMLNPQGNERTSLAGEYWDFYHKMARRKYPSVFAVNR